MCKDGGEPRCIPPTVSVYLLNTSLGDSLRSLCIFASIHLTLNWLVWNSPQAMVVGRTECQIFRWTLNSTYMGSSLLRTNLEIGGKGSGGQSDLSHWHVWEVTQICHNRRDNSSEKFFSPSANSTQVEETFLGFIFHMREIRPEGESDLLKLARKGMKTKSSTQTSMFPSNHRKD